MREYVDFLGSQSPYDELDASDLEALARLVEVEYFTAGTIIITAGEPPLSHFYVVRSGEVEVVDRGRVLANVSSYIVGVILIGLLMLAIQDLPAIMNSALPVKDILATSVGSAFANVIEDVAMLAFFACQVMVQLTGIRVLWSQARDGQIPAAGWMCKVSSQRIPINATLTVFVLSVLFALWSSLLSVLAAMTAIAWALAYGVVVSVGLWGLLRNKLPERPWRYGKASPAIFVLAIVWSIVLSALLVSSDPVHVGLGMLGVIAAGAVICLCIPTSRRGKSIDTDSGHL